MFRITIKCVYCTSLTIYVITHPFPAALSGHFDQPGMPAKSLRRYIFLWTQRRTGISAVLEKQLIELIWMTILFYENIKIYIIDYINYYIVMVESRNYNLCIVGSCPGIFEMYTYMYRNFLLGFIFYFSDK